MLRKPASTLILILTVLCFTATAQDKTPAPPAAQAPAKAAEPAVPPTPAPPAAADSGSNLVVVRVSGEPITEKQVVAAMNVLAKQMVLRPDQESQRNSILFKGAVDNLVTLSLLKAEAKKQNVTVDKARVDQQMQAFAGRYPSKEEFEKAMAGQGLNEAELRKNVEETWSVQELLDRAVKDVPGASDADIQKVYDNNPLPVPERAHVMQIFLKFEPNSTPEKKAELKKKLEGIRADIEAKKITFADAVAKFSQDPNAPKGGDVGFVARNQITVKPLEEAIFSAAPGSLTPIIEGPQGLHLVNVLEIKPSGKMPLEEAKPLIKQQLDQNAKQETTRKYVDGIKAAATIEPFMTAEEFEMRHPANK